MHVFTLKESLTREPKVALVKGQCILDMRKYSVTEENERMGYTFLLSADRVIASSVNTLKN